MTDQVQLNDQEHRLKLYGETRSDLLKRQLSNSENADRAILTVSTAALGFSLSFLKDALPLQTAAYSWLLYLSWVLFPVAIISTVLSFFTSQTAINEQLELARKYYLDHDDEAVKLQPKYASITEYLNRAGAALFIAGLLAICFYVFINLDKGNVMAKLIINEGASIPVIQKVSQNSELLQKGASIPVMQPIHQPAQVGAPVPPMQQISQPAPAVPSATPSKSAGQ